MNTGYERVIMKFELDDDNYEVVTTLHSEIRMLERQVEEEAVSGNIIALGKERIDELILKGEEAIVIDSSKELSVVAGFNSRKITIITVLDSSNIWNNRGTRVERVSW